MSRASFPCEKGDHMNVLSLEQLKASRGRRTKTVSLEGFDLPGAVIIGKLTMAGRDRFAATAQEKDNRLAGVVVLLEEGLLEPKLTKESALALCECDADLVDAMVQEIMAFNGMTKEAAAELKKQFPGEQRSEVPVPAGAEAA